MTEPSDCARQGAGRRSVTWIALALMALLFLPEVRRLDRPYEQDYHGQLTAWFALMAENMEERGFVATRFMPILNPNDAVYPDFRWYLTHPVLDVVLRAGLVRAFGRNPWVHRLQGLVGMAAAAVLLGSIARRIGLSPTEAAVTVAFFIAAPLTLRLSHLSMQHPMTLACGLLVFRLWLGTRPRPAALAVAIFVGAQFDWPGYFAPFLVFVLELCGRRRRALLVACVASVLLSIAWVFVHVDLIVRPGLSLLDALRNAGAVTAEPLTAAAAAARTFAYQRAAFGDIGMAVIALAGLLSLRSASTCRTRFVPWLIAFGYGALHVVVFPMKAPYHDFWGCYWLPIAGLSFGITAEFLLHRLPPRPLTRTLVLGLALGVATTMVWTAPQNEAAIAGGRWHRDQAQAILGAIPAEDRGLFISDWGPETIDPMILGAWLRVNLHARPGLTVDSIDSLRTETRTLFHHVAGWRTLFFQAPPRADDEAATARHADLKRALARIGSPYQPRGRDVMPEVWDLTDFIWND